MPTKALFETDTREHGAILLVDSSGSVTYSRFFDGRIFDKMLAVAEGLPEDKFRVLFWNAPGRTHASKYIEKRPRLSSAKK